MSISVSHTPSRSHLIHQSDIVCVQRLLLFEGAHLFHLLGALVLGGCGAQLSLLGDNDNKWATK